jgi:hypothetical protein
MNSPAIRLLQRHAAVDEALILLQSKLSLRKFASGAYASKKIDRLQHHHGG